MEAIDPEATKPKVAKPKAANQKLPKVCHGWVDIKVGSEWLGW